MIILFIVPITVMLVRQKKVMVNELSDDKEEVLKITPPVIRQKWK
jgi:hypothetical protein